MKGLFGLILKILLIIFLVVAILVGSTLLYYGWKVGETETHDIEDFGDYDSYTEEYINKHGMSVFPKEIPVGFEAKEYHYVTSKSAIDDPGFCVYFKCKAKTGDDLTKELKRLNDSGAMVLADMQKNITVYVMPELLEEKPNRFRDWYFDTDIYDGLSFFFDAAIVNGDGTIEYLYSLYIEGRSSTGNFYSDSFAHTIILEYELNKAASGSLS